ncbi:phosphatase [Thalassolituus hydrocarboniclasticus]|uniref:Phosphatase n=1 Tax=Thalassolituus hydrocarboniclasticus TaxID=2742796 RepID=A0ABY6ABF7_9GAMM|nr:phosphatase [Thalassolituus hydrocarboniclasticus]UXD87764.1 phosphatase [Thalassolituus hydrocarboniclasticus]
MQDRPHRKHAQRIVQNFRNELAQDLADKIGDYHFGSLEVLIESALNTAVMSAMNDTVTDIEQLLKQAQKRAKG